MTSIDKYMSRSGQNEQVRGRTGATARRRSTPFSRTDAEYERLVGQEPSMAESFSESTLRAAAADNLTWHYLFFGVEKIFGHGSPRKRQAFNGQLWK